ncbi:MAG: aminotransferase class V-fold PLP-dependent enzyme [Bacteriovoracales bacterium]|nr:aminotransferase class V-fold PLP-dependent enzyme [Bacteriovoracales bacterium]
MFEAFDVPRNLVPSDPRLACGPSLIPTKNVQRLLEAAPTLLGTSHRKPGVKNLVGEIQEGLADYFNLPEGYEVVLGNGGATFLFDALALGAVEKRSAHFVCGEFSAKWFKSHSLVPWIESVEILAENGQGLTPEPVPGADLICSTLNETSTGVMVDSYEKLKGGRALVAVDATSGGGQIPCDVSAIDFFFFSPQKVFASEGGLFLALMSPRAIEHCLRLALDKKRYIPQIMNLKTAIENSRKCQTFTTPSLSTLFLLNETVKTLGNLGFSQVAQDSQKKADLIYGWAQDRDYLSPYVKEVKYRSLSVATIDLDDRYDVDALLARLRELKVVYDIDSYRKLKRNQFRIPLFPSIAFDDLEKLTKIIDLAIELCA